MLGASSIQELTSTDLLGEITLQMEWLGVGLACLIPLIFFIIAIALAVWVYKDAEKRDESGALWLIIVLLTGIIGLIIWLIVRPDMAEVERKRQQQQYYQQPPQQQQQYHQQPPKQSKQCPSCKNQMRHIDEYNRWYCDSCQEYK